MFGGLEEAGQLQWSAPNRILFHVADAPCHGRQYHDDVLDEYPNGDPRSLNAPDLLKVLEDKNVKYWFAKLTDKTDKMITKFRNLLWMPTMLQQVRTLVASPKICFAQCYNSYFYHFQIHWSDSRKNVSASLYMHMCEIAL